MPSVKVRDNEPFDVALRRFKRSCEKAGILSEVRRREHYEKPTAQRKPKAAAPATDVVDLMQRLKESLAQSAQKKTARSRALPAQTAREPAKKASSGRR